jgi:pimeloyl-ACP methyl ester carboxylesterase
MDFVHVRATGASPTLGNSPWLWARLRRGLVTALAVVAVAVLSGAAFESMAKSVDDRRFPPPGQLVNLGGRKVHVRRAGTSGPTVLLEAGLGSCSQDWEPVLPELARFARVIAYDRAGLGWSDAGPAPRTSPVIADELERLLGSLGEPGPFVLVGHSMGSFHVRAFAARRPDQVAAVVLVDACHENRQAHMTREEIAIAKSALFLRARLCDCLGPFGIPRLYATALKPRNAGAYVAQFPAAAQPVYRYLVRQPNHLRTFFEEDAGFDESAAAVARARLTGDCPLLVVTCLAPPQGFDQQAVYKLHFQTQLMGLSDRSRHIILRPCGHYPQYDQPAALVEAIRSVAKTLVAR